MSVQVYDIESCMFRDINIHNFDDDMECGFVLFSRNILEILKKHFFICGYVLIDKRLKLLSPIDIQEEKIVLFEGTYNCMPADLKEELEKYNLKSCVTNNVISSFFFRWQFLCNRDVLFISNGAFIELCNNILDSPKRFDALCDKGINLYQPTTYEELCYFIQSVLALTEIDIYSYDYKKSFKYLIYSLKQGYHLNITKLEIQNYCIQISRLVNEGWNV